jgi:putative flippase GtrA
MPNPKDIADRLEAAGIDDYTIDLERGIVFVYSRRLSETAPCSKESEEVQPKQRLGIDMRKLPALSAEIMRFLIVGGLAFMVDFSILSLSAEYLFHTEHGWGLYMATALGFLAGVVVNYVLSILFVFRSARTSGYSATYNEFFIFVGLGFIGFLLTELGMYLGAGVFALNYQWAKVLVTGIALGWNYLSRKLILFKDKTMNESRLECDNMV